jgi:hypothetical protein
LEVDAAPFFLQRERAAVDMPPMLPSFSQQDHSRAGRAILALHSVLCRALGSLPLAAALLVSAAVYATIGLALPMATATNGVALLLCNGAGAVLGLSLALACLYPAVEPRPLPSSD